MIDDARAADDDAIEIELRSPEQVGRRLIVLAALCRRAYLETPAGQRELDDEPDAEQFDQVAWLRERGLWDDATPDEQRLLERPVGTLSADDGVAATWNAEALVALGWAANLVADLPPTAPGDPARVLRALPSPWEETEAFLAGVSLSDEEAVAFERERAEIWLWRAEIESDLRSLRGRALAELEADLRDAAAEAVAAGLLDRAVEGDFAVAGRPFRAIGGDAQDAIAAVAAVRLHALNWLSGFGTSWDDVPLDID